MIGGDSIVIRPPSEANSLLLPLTIGCSHNRCAFCHTYKGVRFDILDIDDIKKNIDDIACHYASSVGRVFLENGDAVICPQTLLVSVLSHLREKFPRLERVAAYATPKAALRKTAAQLKELHDLGLRLVYMGLESGDAGVLKNVNKGVTPEQMVEAGRKLKDAGIKTSITVILGLGGEEASERHAISTGEVLSRMDPDFAGALTLVLEPGAPLYREWREGRFKLISPWQSLRELRLIIEHSNFTNCFFTSNHASNYLPLRVRLPEQKTEVLRLLDEVLARKDASRLRPEFIRAL